MQDQDHVSISRILNGNYDRQTYICDDVSYLVPERIAPTSRTESENFFLGNQPVEENVKWLKSRKHGLAVLPSIVYVSEKEGDWEKTCTNSAYSRGIVQSHSIDE